MNGDNYSSRDGLRVREYPPSRGDRDERRDRHRDRERDHTRDYVRDQNRERERERDRDRVRDRDRERNRERRRSRSPDLRAPRRPDPEFDAYSSSRSHRDREREDRYSGRDRRGEREWDRDRGALPRRDARREDEERPVRRERDPYDDRRRGAVRERRDDGGLPRHEVRRSPTPVIQREPTPDLTDVVPVLERKRRLTQWDIKPPGYELVTSEQAKLSGMFPLPGAPRQQAMDPTKLQAFMNHPAGQVTSSALKASNSRQSKRLIVYNVPPETNEESLMAFLNLQLNGLNVIESTDPCILCQFSNDRSFAVLEFKHAMEATVGLALDGVLMENSDTVNGSSTSEASRLTIRRPKDYVMPAIPEELIYDPAIISSHVPDTLHKLCISNIPPFLSEDQVLELLASFGKLKAFVLVKDRSTEESRGIAFIEYLEPTAANETALTTLDGMDVGGRKLRVTKASSGSTQVANFDVGITAISGLASQLSNETDKGRVIQLLNMVTPEELMDIEEYQEICDDVREECTKFGTVLELKAPRPSGGGRQSAGVGKIFVKFDSAASAHKALTALAGRKFADRTVVTTYFPEENFDVGAW